MRCNQWIGHVPGWPVLSVLLTSRLLASCLPPAVRFVRQAFRDLPEPLGFLYKKALVDWITEMTLADVKAPGSLDIRRSPGIPGGAPQWMPRLVQRPLIVQLNTIYLLRHIKNDLPQIFWQEAERWLIGITLSTAPQVSLAVKMAAQLVLTNFNAQAALNYHGYLGSLQSELAQRDEDDRVREGSPCEQVPDELGLKAGGDTAEVCRLSNSEHGVGEITIRDLDHPSTPLRSVECSSVFKRPGKQEARPSPLEVILGPGVDPQDDVDPGPSEKYLKRVAADWKDPPEGMAEHVSDAPPGDKGRRKRPRRLKYFPNGALHVSSTAVRGSPCSSPFPLTMTAMVEAVLAHEDGNSSELIESPSADANHEAAAMDIDMAVVEEAIKPRTVTRDTSLGEDEVTTLMGAQRLPGAEEEEHAEAMREVAPTLFGEDEETTRATTGLRYREHENMRLDSLVQQMVNLEVDLDPEHFDFQLLHDLLLDAVKAGDHNHIQRLPWRELGDDAILLLCQRCVTGDLSSACCKVLLPLLLTPAVMALKTTASLPLTAAVMHAAEQHPRALMDTVIASCLSPPHELSMVQVQLMAKVVRQHPASPIQQWMVESVLSVAEGDRPLWKEGHLALLQSLWDHKDASCPAPVIDKFIRAVEVHAVVLGTSAAFLRVVLTFVKHFGGDLDATARGRLHDAVQNTKSFMTRTVLGLLACGTYSLA